MKKIYWIASTAVLAILMIGCGSRGNGASDSDSSQPKDSLQAGREQYHADLDIAMLVGSITDAISQGETLSSSQYDGVASLTDGTGMPLYNTVQNGPGEWRVVVDGPAKAQIYNLMQGNLSGSDLCEYVIGYLADRRPQDPPRMERKVLSDSVMQTVYVFQDFNVAFHDSLTNNGSMLNLYIERVSL